MQRRYRLPGDFRVTSRRSRPAVEYLLAKLIQKAIDGDMQAARIIMERVDPAEAKVSVEASGSVALTFAGLAALVLHPAPDGKGRSLMDPKPVECIDVPIIESKECASVVPRGAVGQARVASNGGEVAGSNPAGATTTDVPSEECAKVSEQGPSIASEERAIVGEPCVEAQGSEELSDDELQAYAHAQGSEGVETEEHNVYIVGEGRVEKRTCIIEGRADGNVDLPGTLTWTDANAPPGGSEDPADGAGVEGPPVSDMKEHEASQEVTDGAELPEGS